MDGERKKDLDERNIEEQLAIHGEEADNSGGNPGAAGDTGPKGEGADSGKDAGDGSGGGGNDGGTPPGEEEKPRRRRRWPWVILIVLLAMLGVAASYAWAFFNQVQETQKVLLDDVVFEEEYEIGEAFSESIVNIALLGFDRGWNRENLGEYLFRPDMMAIFSINLETDQVSVVRLTRDSYVPIHGTRGAYDKINHSYAYGYYSSGNETEEEKDAAGIRYTLQTLSHALGGVPIHYSIVVDMYSVVELVDAVGGIYYEVEETLYDHHWNVGEVLVPEGPQIMDGRTYLRYLQYRDDRTGQDFGRIDRQMDLLKHTFLYLKEEGRLQDIPKIYRVYKDYVDTDLTYKQIAALAFYGTDFKVTEESLHFYTLPGDGQMKDGIWYQVLRQNDRVRIIADVFGIQAEKWPPIVLEDSPEYLAEQERKRLEEELGYELGEDFEWHQVDWENIEDYEGIMQRVPEVRGMTPEAAEAALTDAGYTVGQVRHEHYKFISSGLVFKTEPYAGSLRPEGAVINIVVSAGPEAGAD